MKQTKKQRQKTKTENIQKTIVEAGLVSAQETPTSGITLISLVITIIVLLILASVAINLTLGENGIFTKAKEAKRQMEIATTKEQIQMDILTEQLGSNGKIIQDKLIEILDKYGEVQKDEEGNITGIITDKGDHFISIEDILNNEQISPPTPENPSEEKISNIILNKNILELEEGKKETLTITIEPENITNKEVEWTSSNIEIATVNEQGEITAVKEGTATITVKAKNNNTIKAECTITVAKSKGTPGTSGYVGGAYNDPYIPKGFKYTGVGTWNSGYTIIGETSSIGNEFVWVPCVLTAEEQQVAQSNGDEVQIFQKTTTGKYNSSSYGLLPTDTTVNPEDNSVQAIEDSVHWYGGFYIAKYEAGIEGTKENYSFSSSERTPTDGTFLPFSKANKGVWNVVTRSQAISLSKKMIDYEATGVHSTLISGAAWDTTLQWMVNSSDNKEVNARYDIYSRGKGWLSDVSENARRSTTGYYSINNVYDMAGNVSEWTTENCVRNGSNYFIIRGRFFRPRRYRNSCCRPFLLFQ